jgi:hypothetical protein
MNHLTTQEAKSLASQIASALGEPGNVEYYLKYVQQIPKDYLLEKLSYVLSKEDIDNKAAYFNSILISYGGNHKRFRP